MDTETYSKAKAAVMAMLKFILMFLIIAAICYFATKIVSVLIPFLLGFLLSKTSITLASPAAKLYKECMQSYMNAIRILLNTLRKVESSAADELLERLKEFSLGE